MYAEVAVNAPLGRRAGSPQKLSRLEPSDETAQKEDALSELQGMTFHYAIPGSLAERVAVGQVVQVPFGSQRRQGVILALSESSPVEETREIEAILELEPAISPLHIALARWISRYYLCPLISALRLMWAPGTERYPQTIVALRDAAALPADASEREKAAIARLQAQGALPLKRLARELDWPEAHSGVERLARSGVLDRQFELTPPRAGPKIERTVRLVAGPEEIAAARRSLGRASKQADILEWLVSSDDPLPTLEEMGVQVGCSAGPPRELAARGWVEITKRRVVVDLRADRQAVEQALADKLQNRPAERAVLARLRELGRPATIAELQAPPAVLRALAGEGLIARRREEPLILLRLSPREVEEAVTALRGQERHVEVLRLLAEEKEPLWIGWVYAQTDANLKTLGDLEAAGLIVLEDREVWRDPLLGRAFVLEQPPKLTPDQERAWQEIRQGLQETWRLNPLSLEGKGPPVYLLHGVTGSGKTEIYLRAIQAALSAGKGAIMLVPEISLTPQTIRRLASRFPGKVTVLHSRLSLGERYDAWRRIRAGQFPVVVGSRSALFAPLPSLGLIVLDEEHAEAYKQQGAPRYHAREVALKLAELSAAAVILGSATPDVVSFYRARQGRYRLLELPRRILGHRRYLEAQRIQYNLPDRGRLKRLGEEVCYLDLPPVQVVDLRAELRAGNRSIFSRLLQREMARVLDAGEQVILFLNRRGAATFVLCRDCGQALKCRRCEVPLTYHQPPGGEEILLCHHCGRREPVPARCPQCASSRIRYFGLGTQRVEAAVQEAFPGVKVLRWDLDTARLKGAHELFLSQFAAGQSQVLVGTQMIAKGLDLPLVTLVGVISADTALHFPDYHAGERTFQLLEQVAGRAGRSPLGGQVIIQTYNPEHYSIQAAARHDYEHFYRQELAFRRQQGYPPFRRLARLLYLHRNAQQCEAEAGRMAALLRHTTARLGLPEIELIGPAPCFLGRLQGHYRWQLLVRAPDPTLLLRQVAYPLGWRIDVDPASLL
jgi:primosomal protein N' (replication factor Y)